MQTLKFIGRGSAFNTIEGNNAAYIKDNDKMLLIDCGENIFERIINLKLLDNIKEINILITHCHSDHVGSVGSLILYCYYMKHIKCNLYVPDYRFIKVIEGMGVTQEHCNIIKCAGTRISSMDIALEFLSTIHCDELNAYAIQLIITKNLNSNIIYYSGDTNMSPTEMIIMKDINEIYQDTCLADYDGNVHTSLNKLCARISKDNRDKIYCMHIDCEELIGKAKQEGFNVVEVERGNK